MTKKIKVLLSKLGLDVHNRGIITVAKALSSAGMEVVYLGNALPEEIVSVAIQEDVDVVGVSSLGGAHLSRKGTVTSWDHSAQVVLESGEVTFVTVHESYILGVWDAQNIETGHAFVENVLASIDETPD